MFIQGGPNLTGRVAGNFSPLPVVVVKVFLMEQQLDQGTS